MKFGSLLIQVLLDADDANRRHRPSQTKEAEPDKQRQDSRPTKSFIGSPEMSSSLGHGEVPCLDGRLLKGVGAHQDAVDLFLRDRLAKDPVPELGRFVVYRRIS